MDILTTAVTEQGIVFRHGEPVSFRYVRNNNPAPDMGALFQQDIEPAGRYLIHNEDPGERPLAEGWEVGEVTLRNPLVIPFNSDPNPPRYYNETSWKAALHQEYGCTGQDLARALLAAGHDGVVTVMLSPDGVPYGTREIVQLSQRRDT